MKTLLRTICITSIYILFTSSLVLSQGNLVLIDSQSSDWINTNIHINVGDTVIWVNNDDWEGINTKHFVAAHTNEFRSGILYRDDT